MSFGEAIKTVFSKYADFSGRARRSEYWFWYLFYTIVSSVLSGVGTAIAGGSDNPAMAGGLSGVFALAALVPTLAVTARRLHDIGKSGWWILLSLVPCIGSIILLIWTIKDSEPGYNQYGPNPKDEGNFNGSVDGGAF